MASCTEASKHGGVILKTSLLSLSSLSDERGWSLAYLTGHGYCYVSFVV